MPVELSRNFTWTLNNYTDQEVQEIRDIFTTQRVRCLIFGRELAPTTGTPHLQGFIQFTNSRRLAAVIRIFPPRVSHISVALGTAFQAYDYCRKDGDYEEFGTAPQPVGRAGGEAHAEVWQETLVLARTNQLDLIEPRMLIQHYSTLKRIARDYMRKPEPLESTCGLWIYGASGTGKTHSVVTSFPDRYIKPLNKWWDGYQDEMVVHLDEICPAHTSWITPYLKKWADKWPFDAEVKGGALQIRPSRIIVTSNYSIEEMNFLVQDYDAIRRRFRQVQKFRDQNLIL